MFSSEILTIQLVFPALPSVLDTQQPGEEGEYCVGMTMSIYGIAGVDVGTTNRMVRRARSAGYANSTEAAKH
jgi:hypothetical protein